MIRSRLIGLRRFDTFVAQERKSYIEAYKKSCIPYYNA
jgi:hypothetical protein